MNQQIYDEASQWLVEFRTEEPDRGTKKRFERWLSASPEHVCAYLELTAVWETVAAQQPSAPRDAETLIQRARSSQNIVQLAPGIIGSQSDNSPKPLASAGLLTRASNRRRLFALAATVLFATIITGTYLYTQRDTYSTAVGEQRSILLRDGSIIDLNALSKVRVHLTDKERHIDLLGGQALFRVAKDKTRPFVVAANETLVRALGTQFDINERKRALIVTVVEGTVAVEASSSSSGHADFSGVRAQGTTSPGGQPTSIDRVPAAALESIAARDHAHGAAAQGSESAVSRQAGPILLGAGQQVAIPAGGPVAAGAELDPVPRPADLDRTMAWTRRRLIFDSTSLEEVAEEFNRNSERPLIIEGQGLDDFHISGAFSSADPQSLLRFLRAQRGIQVTERDGRIVVSRVD